MPTVIAVLAVVVGVRLICQVGRSVTASSQAATCSANLRHMGYSITQYTSDYDNHLPVVEAGGTDAAARLQWADFTHDRCMRLSSESRWLLHCSADGVPGATSYALNARLFGRSPGPGLIGGSSVAGLPNPEGVYLVLEPDSRQSPNDGLFDPDRKRLAFRHYTRGKMETGILFLDGHANMLTADQLASPSSPELKGWLPPEFASRAER